PATVYPLSLHDALPISVAALTVLYALGTLVPTGTGTTLTSSLGGWATGAVAAAASASLLYAARRRASAFEDAGLEADGADGPARSEEHTSELQSRENLV